MPFQQLQVHDSAQCGVLCRLRHVTADWTCFKVWFKIKLVVWRFSHNWFYCCLLCRILDHLGEIGNTYTEFALLCSGICTGIYFIYHQSGMQDIICISK